MGLAPLTYLPVWFLYTCASSLTPVPKGVLTRWDCLKAKSLSKPVRSFKYFVTVMEDVLVLVARVCKSVKLQFVFLNFKTYGCDVLFFTKEQLSCKIIELIFM